MSLTYAQAVQRLEWLGHEGRSLKWDLNNVRAVLERLGHPERRFASVHVAGTNGKGSVAAMVESILRAAGARTGLYTSPHLERINERIAAGGTPVGDTDFAAAFNAVADAIESLLAEARLPNHPSFFETLTAMAFWHFAQAGAKVAVLEVGMGGRLDATNVVTPEVAVITSIDFDHERYLGHSIEQIAAEKSGIIKPAVPVVDAAEHPLARSVVAARAAELRAPVVDVETYWPEAASVSDFGRYQFDACAADGFRLRLSPSLRGAFQTRNALTALAAVRELTRRGWAIPAEAIATGIAAATWPGRLELVRRDPLVFLDGAHNPAGARQVLLFWEEHLASRRIHLVYGTVREKAVGEIAELLFPPAASVTLTEPATPRAAGAESLADLVRSLNPNVRLERDPAQALARALDSAGRDDVVFVTGSLFLVGDCRKTLREVAPALTTKGSDR
ncbi:MAG: bifunctional folylpolyglutamate synthase/dihydrofolate synthase [Acidobacteria bacterium]|nr:bifunctional folylpolyglutamate synthase/dihydrofolate synthase [Acidobacteriota bacterium]